MKANLLKSSHPIGSLLNYRGGVYRVIKHGNVFIEFPGPVGVCEMELELTDIEYPCDISPDDGLGLDFPLPKFKSRPSNIPAEPAMVNPGASLENKIREVQASIDKAYELADKAIKQQDEIIALQDTRIKELEAEIIMLRQYILEHPS